MNKKYELLQDLPYVKKGAIYEQDGIRYTCNSGEFISDLNADSLSFQSIENNPTWFREVAQEPKIEINSVNRCYTKHNTVYDNDTNMLGITFGFNKMLSEQEMATVKSAIEKTLNTSTPTSELVEDKKELSAIDTLRMNEEGVNVFNHDTINKRLDRIHYLQALGCDLISRIYHYGNFKAETMTERVLEKVLIELQLFPTTEDEILKRPPLPNSIEPTTTNDKEVKKDDGGEMQKQLFTTIDNVSIFRGGTYYSVTDDFKILRTDRATAINGGTLRAFSTEDKAKEYVSYHKKQFSAKDICEITAKYGVSAVPIEKEIIEKSKQ